MVNGRIFNADPKTNVKTNVAATHRGRYFKENLTDFVHRFGVHSMRNWYTKRNAVRESTNKNKKKYY